MESNDNAEALTTIRKIKILRKELSVANTNISSVEEIFNDNSLLRKHQSLKQECNKLMKFETFRREAIENFWRNCIYEPITIYKSFDDLEEEDCIMLKKFISKSVAELSKFLAEYPELQFQFILLLYLGDLYRYSFAYCGKDQRDIEVAKQCYRKALLADPENGRPYNQLALLAKENSLDEALFMFLRSLTQQKEQMQAMKNFKLLDETKFVNAEFLTLYRFAMVSMFDFNRLQFEEVRKEFDKILEEPKEDCTFLRMINMCSLIAKYVFDNEPIDEQFRYIASFLCQKMYFLTEEARRKLGEREEDAQLNNRRRRKKSSSTTDSESDTDGEEDENDDATEELSQEMQSVWMSAIIVAEFLNDCGKQFTQRKLSVSLKLQFQNLLKSFLDLLNDLLDSIANLMSPTTTTSKSLLIDWSLGNFYADQKIGEKKLAKMLAYFLRNCVAERRVGITFDKYFKLNSASVEKEKQAMENISKLHITHISEMNEKASRIPVYLAPDHLIFLDSLALMEKLMASSRQTIIVARAVLAKLDKAKKENANAREAIRWIQNSLAAGRVRMLPESGKNFIGECLQFLEEKKLLDKQTLFISILTTKGCEEYKGREEFSKYPALAFETIGDFIGRTKASGSKLDRPK